MSLPGTHLSREAEAVAEMAATRISRSGSFALTLALLAAIAVGAVLEAARARRGEATAFAGEAPIPAPGVLLATLRSEGALAANRALRQSLAALEDRLGRESALSAALRPAAQTVLARALGYGNSQVVVGRQGWLYFRTEFDYLTGPPFLAPRELARRRTPGARYHVAEPDPVPGLVRLHDELAERGIELVFFPVPVKAQVHPEHLVRFSALGAADAGEAAGLANPSFPELVRRLGEAGIPVYDALPELRAATRAGEAVYFATDTHWNAAGMRIAAAGLARFLRGEAALPPRPPAGLRRRSFPHQFKGDLTRMLGAGIGGPIFAPERIELDEIVGLGDLPYHTKPAVGQRRSFVGRQLLADLCLGRRRQRRQLRRAARLRARSPGAAQRQGSGQRTQGSRAMAAGRSGGPFGGARGDLPGHRTRSLVRRLGQQPAATRTTEEEEAMNDLRFPIGKFTLPAAFTPELRRQYVAEIAACPRELRRAVAGLTQAQLDTPYRDGGWTVRQVVHHVPDSHMNAYIRHKLAATEDQPTIRPYREAPGPSSPTARAATSTSRCSCSKPCTNAGTVS